MKKLNKKHDITIEEVAVLVSIIIKEQPTIEESRIAFQKMIKLSLESNKPIVICL